MTSGSPDTNPMRVVSPRQAFDELLRRRVEAMTAPAIAAGPVGQGTPSPVVLAADEMAHHYRTFADAVDATGTGVPYEDAVVIVGDAGTVVAHARDYADTPIYWQTLAGEVEAIITGAQVMRNLHT